jgi:transposase
MSNIIERAARRNAYIVFVDEAGFMCEPLCVKSWAPKGCPPVLRVSTPHERISVAGAITVSPFARRYGFFYEMLADNHNYRGASIAAFLERLWQRIRQPMTILWDSIPIHFAKPVRDFLSHHRQVVIEPFPPYAPELNPVDGVWGYVKRFRTCNFCPNTIVELRARVRRELNAMKSRQDLLRSFQARALGWSFEPYER